MTKLILSTAVLLGSIAFAQDHRVIVTAEAHKDAAPPDITRQDVMVSVDNQRGQVTSWKPIATAGTELWVLIDDGSDTAVGLELQGLRKFLLDQPESTQIGVGYLRNGDVAVVQRMTSDHSAAAKSLRLPLGSPGISSSPYMAIKELVHKWPETEHAREVLLISSGIDAFNGPGPTNPYLTQAVDAAQRAGVVVNSIYFGSAGHFGHSYWQITWGQNFLSQISEETGGEFYWQGNSNPVSFAPYLKQFSERLKSQYLLAFQATPSGHGSEKLKVTTEIPHAMLVTQSRVFTGSK